MNIQYSKKLQVSAGQKGAFFPRYMLAVIAYAILFSFWQVTEVPFDIHLLAITLAATCCIPFFIWRVQGKQSAPLFELICLSYAVQFSVPIYTQPNSIDYIGGKLVLSWDSIGGALQYTELGVIFLILGYYLMRYNPLLQTLRPVNLLIQPQKRNPQLLLAVLIGCVFTSLNLITNWGTLRAISLLLANQLYIAIVILAFRVYRGQEASLFWQRILYGLIGYGFLAGLTTGMLETALIPVVLVVIVYWQIRRHVSWALLLLGVVVFFILNDAKHEYRYQLRNEKLYNINEKLLVWFDLVIESTNKLVFDPHGEREASLQQTLARFDLIHRFAHIQTMTPAIVPYYYGESYTYFVVAWIPRAIWPNKPVASTASNRMDLDYLLKYSEDTSTSIGIGLLPEAYANFGLLGILFFAAINGSLFAILDATLNVPNSDGGKAIYIISMITFLNGIGSAAALLFGALFQQIIANVILLYPFTQATAIPRRFSYSLTSGSAPATYPTSVQTKSYIKRKR